MKFINLNMFQERIRTLRNINIILFVVILVICLIKNSQTLYFINESLLDRSNFVILFLVFSLSLNNRFTTFCLITFVLITLMLELS